MRASVSFRVRQSYPLFPTKIQKRHLCKTQQNSVSGRKCPGGEQGSRIQIPSTHSKEGKEEGTFHHHARSKYDSL